MPRTSTKQAVLVGAAAGIAWRAVEPALRRLFGHPYSDPELATAFITRGRWQLPLDYLVQATGGGAFAALTNRFVGLGRLVPAVLAENAALLGAAPLIDRIHPDVRDGSWPPLAGNLRAAGVSVSGHLFYGLLVRSLLR
jgi:hypothetical protein